MTELKPSAPATLMVRVERWMIQRMPWIWLSCEQFQQLASAAMDRPPSTWVRVKLALHRLACGFCRDQEHHQRQLRTLVREPIEPAATTLTPELEQRLRAAMAAAHPRESNAGRS